MIRTPDELILLCCARELTAWRMARVANRLMPGYDFRGCTKGHIAQLLARHRTTNEQFLAAARSLGLLPEGS